MRLDDPLRPQTGERPAWRDAPQIVIPALQLMPHGDGWAVMFYLPSDLKRFAFAPVSYEFEGLGPLAEFLTSWRESPENCVRQYFNREPPKGRGWHPSQEEPKVVATTEKSLVDLGL